MVCIGIVMEGGDNITDHISRLCWLVTTATSPGQLEAIRRYVGRSICRGEDRPWGSTT
jgi:hypothetical protein